MASYCSIVPILISILDPRKNLITEFSSASPSIRFFSFSRKERKTFVSRILMRANGITAPGIYPPFFKHFLCVLRGFALAKEERKVCFVSFLRENVFMAVYPTWYVRKERRGKKLKGPSWEKGCDLVWAPKQIFRVGSSFSQLALYATFFIILCAFLFWNANKECMRND